MRKTEAGSKIEKKAIGGITDHGICQSENAEVGPGAGPLTHWYRLEARGLVDRAEAIEVSIFEYDEETHMRQVREEGWEDGREKGRTEGEWIKLISLVKKKLIKDLSADAIANMLEESKPLIEELIDLIERNPGKSEQELGGIYANERQEVHA